MESLDRFAEDKLAELDRRGTRRRLTETWREDGVVAWRGGRRLVSFSCNDYLGLTHHPAVKAAAAEAVVRYGAGAGASRLVTGDHPLYRALEERLARLKGTEAAIVFGSGYLANLAVVPALAGSRDLILVDALAHSCLQSAARLSSARAEIFAHNDLTALQLRLERLRRDYEHCLILTETVFSMDGDRAPLPRMAALARIHDSWLLADDAHGTGVLPPPGATLVPLQMGTLSKALGSYGGYLAASAGVIELLYSRARPLVYTTALPPASVAAAGAALDVMAAEPGRSALPLAKARLFTQALGLPPPESQIVPVVIGDSEDTMQASAALEAEGFLVAAIRPPTVPLGTARLRVTFTAGHGDDQVLALAEAMKRVLGRP